MDLFGETRYEKNCKIYQFQVGWPDKQLVWIDPWSMEILDFRYIKDKNNYFIDWEMNTWDLQGITEYLNQREKRDTWEIFNWWQKEMTLLEYNKGTYLNKFNNWILKIKCKD